MSNTQAPNGFSFIRLVGSSEPNFAFDEQPITYNYGTKIAYGDPVQLVAGYTVIWATSDYFMGIFIGCEYQDSVQGKVWSRSWNAPSTAVSGSVVAKINIDPRSVFFVQAGGSTTVGVTQASVGLNADAGGVGAPNAAGTSVAYLDASTITTAAKAFRIVGLGQNVNNDVASPYDWVNVQMNLDQLTYATGQ